MAKEAIDLTPSYTIRSIPEDTRADIEDLLESGLRPKQVHDNHYPEIPIKLIQAIKRATYRKDDDEDPYAEIDAQLDAAGYPPAHPAHPARSARPSAAPARVPVSVPVAVAPEIAEIQAKMEKMRLQRQLEELEDELDYARKRRQLKIEREELELERKRREMDHFYAEEAPADAPDAPAASPFPFTEAGDENGVVRDILRFLTVVAQKPPRPNPPQSGAPSAPSASVTPTMPTIDPTQPFTDEQINAELSRYTPEQIAQAKAVPESVIEWQLKQRFPGILPENIKRVIARIRHYGDTSLRSEEEPANR